MNPFLDDDDDRDDDVASVVSSQPASSKSTASRRSFYQKLKPEAALKKIKKGASEFTKKGGEFFQEIKAIASKSNFSKSETQDNEEQTETVYVARPFDPKKTEIIKVYFPDESYRTIAIDGTTSSSELLEKIKERSREKGDNLEDIEKCQVYMTTFDQNDRFLHPNEKPLAVVSSLEKENGRYYSARFSIRPLDAGMEFFSGKKNQIEEHQTLEKRKRLLEEKRRSLIVTDEVASSFARSRVGSNGTYASGNPSSLRRTRATAENDNQDQSTEEDSRRSGSTPRSGTSHPTQHARSQSSSSSSTFTSRGERHGSINNVVNSSPLVEEKEEEDSGTNPFESPKLRRKSSHTSSKSIPSITGYTNSSASSPPKNQDPTGVPSSNPFINSNPESNGLPRSSRHVPSSSISSSSAMNTDDNDIASMFRPAKRDKSNDSLSVVPPASQRSAIQKDDDNVTEGNGDSLRRSVSSRRSIPSSTSSSGAAAVAAAVSISSNSNNPKDSKEESRVQAPQSRSRASSRSETAAPKPPSTSSRSGHTKPTNQIEWPSATKLDLVMSLNEHNKCLYKQVLECILDPFPKAVFDDTVIFSPQPTLEDLSLAAQVFGTEEIEGFVRALFSVPESEHYEIADSVKSEIRNNKGLQQFLRRRLNNMDANTFYSREAFEHHAEWEDWKLKEKLFITTWLAELKMVQTKKIRFDSKLRVQVLQGSNIKVDGRNAKIWCRLVVDDQRQMTPEIDADKNVEWDHDAFFWDLKWPTSILELELWSSHEDEFSGGKRVKSAIGSYSIPISALEWDRGLCSCEAWVPVEMDDKKTGEILLRISQVWEEEFRHGGILRYQIIKNPTIDPVYVLLRQDNDTPYLYIINGPTRESLTNGFVHEEPQEETPSMSRHSSLNSINEVPMSNSASSSPRVSRRGVPEPTEAISAVAANILSLPENACLASAELQVKVVNHENKKLLPLSQKYKQRTVVMTRMELYIYKDKDDYKSIKSQGANVKLITDGSKSVIRITSDSGVEYYLQFTDKNQMNEWHEKLVVITSKKQLQQEGARPISSRGTFSLNRNHLMENSSSNDSLRGGGSIRHVRVRIPISKQDELTKTLNINENTTVKDFLATISQYSSMANRGNSFSVLKMAPDYTSTVLQNDELLQPILSTNMVRIRDDETGGAFPVEPFQHTRSASDKAIAAIQASSESRPDSRSGLRKLLSSASSENKSNKNSSSAASANDAVLSSEDPAKITTAPRGLILHQQLKDCYLLPVDDSPNGTFAFTIHFKEASRNITLMANSAEDRRKWMEAIQRMNDECKKKLRLSNMYRVRRNVLDNPKLHQNLIADIRALERQVQEMTDAGLEPPPELQQKLTELRTQWVDAEGKRTDFQAAVTEELDEVGTATWDVGEGDFELPMTDQPQLIETLIDLILEYNEAHDLISVDAEFIDKQMNISEQISLQQKYQLEEIIDWQMHDVMVPRISLISKLILEKYAMRQGISPAFVQLLIFSRLLKKGEANRFVLLKWMQIIVNTMKKHGINLTLTEEKLQSEVVRTLHRSICADLLRYRDVFPLGENHFKETVSLFSICHEIRARKEHGLSSLPETIADLIQISAHDTYQRLHMLTSPNKSLGGGVENSPQQLTNFVALIGDEIEQDVKYFDPLFPKGVNAAGITVEVFFERMAVDLNQCILRMQLNNMDMFELYFKLQNFNEKYVGYVSNPDFDRNCLLLTFSPYVVHWLENTENKIVEWSNTAYASDKWLPESSTVLHSSSVVDIFCCLQQSLEFLLSLQWPEKVLARHFLTRFATVVCEALRVYMMKIMHDCENFKKIFLTNEEAAQVPQKVGLPGEDDTHFPKYLTKEGLQICVRLNNIEFTRQQLHEVYEEIDVDAVAKEEITYSKLPSSAALNELKKVKSDHSLAGSNLNIAENSAEKKSDGMDEDNEDEEHVPAIKREFQDMFSYLKKEPIQVVQKPITEEIKITIVQKLRQGFPFLYRSQSNINLSAAATGALNAASKTWKSFFGGKKVAPDEISSNSNANSNAAPSATSPSKEIAAACAETANEATQDAIDYMNNCFESLSESLYPASFKKILRECWKIVIETIVADVMKSGHAWTDSEVAILKDNVQLFVDFFHGEGEGLSQTVLSKGPEYRTLEFLLDQVVTLSTEEIISSCETLDAILKSPSGGDATQRSERNFTLEILAGRRNCGDREAKDFLRGRTDIPSEMSINTSSNPPNRLIVGGPNSASAPMSAKSPTANAGQWLWGWTSSATPSG